MPSEENEVNANYEVYKQVSGEYGNTLSLPPNNLIQKDLRIMPAYFGVQA